MPLGDPTGTELRDYLSALRRRKGLVILTVIMAVASAVLASSLQTEVYESSGRILLRARQSPLSQQDSFRVDAGVVETEIEVMQSEPVLLAARERLGVRPKPRIRQVGTTSVVEVTMRSTDPRRAAELANGYVESYLDFRRKQWVDQLQATTQELQGRVDALQGRIDDLGNQLANLPPCTGLNPPPGACDRRNALQRDRDSLVSQQVPLKQQLDQVQVGLNIQDAGAELVTPAVVPRSPVEPTPVRNALLALGLGLVFGVGLALLFEHLDDSVRSKDDLERVGRGLPVVALIPAVAGWKDRARTQVVSVSEPSSPSAEAYRTLRTSIRFMAVERPLRVIQITSPTAGEGKTTTTANLAVALARAGERVVVVSCDLRRPRLHEFFGLSNKVGFTSVLLGEAPLSAALQQVDPDDDRLWLLGSGPLAPNPSELLSSTQAGEVLTSLKAYADTVLIDCPPVLPVTDSAVLAAKVDGTLLVVAAGMSTGRQVTRCVEMLRQVGAPLVGTVLNNASPDSAHGYSYQYYYGSERASGRSRPEKGAAANGQKGKEVEPAPAGSRRRR